jgi:hypothetical protein
MLLWKAIRKFVKTSKFWLNSDKVKYLFAYIFSFSFGHFHSWK